MSDLPRARERGKPKQEVRLAKWGQKLQEEGVEMGNPVMAPKKVDTRARGQVEPIVTNMFAMNVTKSVEVYRYDIVISQQFTKQDGSTGRIMLTKKAYGGDTTAYNHREKCGYIFDICIRDHPPLKDSRAVYYDLQSIAYSLDRLQMDQRGDGKEEATFDVPMTEELHRLFQGASGIQVTISPVQGTSFVTSLNDLSGVSRDLTRVSRTLLQFFDIATSQHAMFSRDEHCPISCNRSYLMEPTHHGFNPQDVAHFPDNQSYLAIGAQKSTHCIEGTQKGKQLALVIETKKMSSSARGQSPPPPDPEPEQQQPKQQPKQKPKNGVCLECGSEGPIGDPCGHVLKTHPKIEMCPGVYQ